VQYNRSATEDAKLIGLVGQWGAKKWSNIASAMGTRSAKQCRERWVNTLDPSLKKVSVCDIFFLAVLGQISVFALCQYVTCCLCAGEWCA
jgi:Myb-like DNA-binding domain